MHTEIIRELADILVTKWTPIDVFIIVLLFVNLLFFFSRAKHQADKIYLHFNRTDSVSALPEDARGRIENNTEKETVLSAQELLRSRGIMNRNYTRFSIITTMFPLLGMLGTVVSMIPMVNSIGAENAQLFFAALTSTFWGIVCALICKAFDILIYYKIDDNEKHLEYLLNPKRNGQ